MDRISLIMVLSVRLERPENTEMVGKLSTMRGGGLMPDREMVSGEAKRVWDYYLKNRSDVTAHQLDNLKDELTPGYKPDNCMHRSTEEEHEEDIRTSSLSRRYTKEPAVMTALRKAGRIID